MIHYSVCLEKLQIVVYLFLGKMLAFLFLPFWNLCTQIRCPQNWYNNLKLDQAEIKMKWETFFVSSEKYSNIKIQKIENITLKISWSIHPTISAEKSNL